MKIIDLKVEVGKSASKGIKYCLNAYADSVSGATISKAALTWNTYEFAGLDTAAKVRARQDTSSRLQGFMASTDSS